MTEYLIATSVLESIVRGSLAGDERIKSHNALPLVGGHAAEVLVQDESCSVVVHLDVRMGEFMPEVAAAVRSKVLGSLGPMTGLSVSNVDVVFGGVFPAGS